MGKSLWSCEGAEKTIARREIQKAQRRQMRRLRHYAFAAPACGGRATVTRDTNTSGPGGVRRSYS
jgi:hypothetical protein